MYRHWARCCLGRTRREPGSEICRDFHVEACPQLGLGDEHILDELMAWIVLAEAFFPL